MKIKTDFVTNSSSTSFLLISKEEGLTEKDFMDLMGVNKDSDFYQIVEDLFYQINSNLEDIEYSYTSGYFKNNYDSFGFLAGESAKPSTESSTYS